MDNSRTWSTSNPGTRIYRRHIKNITQKTLVIFLKFPMSFLKEKTKYLKLLTRMTGSFLQNYWILFKKISIRFIWKSKLVYHEIAKVATPSTTAKWGNIFKVVKERKCEPKISCSSNLIFTSKNYKLLLICKY